MKRGRALCSAKAGCSYRRPGLLEPLTLTLSHVVLSRAALAPLWVAGCFLPRILRPGQIMSHNSTGPLPSPPSNSSMGSPCTAMLHYFLSGLSAFLTHFVTPSPPLAGLACSFPSTISVDRNPVCLQGRLLPEAFWICPAWEPLVLCVFWVLSLVLRIHRPPHPHLPLTLGFWKERQACLYPE